MNKVYLLLRDNHQSGPYTIDELIQQQLKATDLVWVEGRSNAWNYPYEMEEFKSIVQPPVEKWQPAIPKPAAKPKKQENSELPSLASASYEMEDLEEKAERIRLHTIRHAQQNELPYLDTASNAANGSWAVRENIHFVHHTRKKYVTLPQLIATGLVTILLASAWYGDWSMIKVRPEVVTAAAAPAAFYEEKPVTPQASFASVTDSQTVAEEFQPAHNAATVTASSSEAYTQKPVVNTESLAAIPEIEDAETVSAVENVAQHAAKKEVIVPVELKETRKEPVQPIAKPVDSAKKEPVAEVKETKEVEEEQPREKKKLGQVIKGIFKKKDRE